MITLELRSDERKLAYWGFQFPGEAPTLQVKATGHGWQTWPADTDYTPPSVIDNPAGTVWYPIWFAGDEVDTITQGAHPAGTFVLGSTSRMDVRLVNYPTILVQFVGRVVLLDGSPVS